MAINNSQMPSYDEDQLQSTDCMSLRDCPTPSISHFDDFDANLFLNDPAFSIDLNWNSSNSGDNNMMAMNSGINATMDGNNNFQIMQNVAPLTNSLVGEGVTIQNVNQTNYIDMHSMQSTSFHTNTTTAYINNGTVSYESELPTTYTNDTVGYYPEDIKPFITDTTTLTTTNAIKEEDNSSTMTTTNKKLINKSKCMSRNAILARQNRDKKKSELHTLHKRVKELEEENATLKKKNYDVTENFVKLQSKITYLEAVIQNLPHIVTMVDHMNKYNEPNAGGGGGGGPNTSKKT